MALVLDIESVPQSAEILNAKIPEEIRNPVMPPEIESPDEPNWQEKCPLYSLPELRKKATEAGAELWREVEAAKAVSNEDVKTREKAGKSLAAAEQKEAKAKAAVTAAQEKRDKWIAENLSKWKHAGTMARQKWELGVIEAKAKFIRDAALDARLAHCKLIGLRSTREKWTRVFIWEPDKSKIQKIRDWVKGLWDEKAQNTLFRGQQLIVPEFREEGAMLKAFFSVFAGEMEGDPLDDSREFQRQDCITYFGNTFDFPFLYRRAWMLGVAQRPLFKRGRYFEDRMIDIHEVWQFGDREAKSGGLEGMSTALGLPAVKANDSGSFSEWYDADPVEGVCHLINDLEATEFSARKMGIILGGK